MTFIALRAGIKEAIKVTALSNNCLESATPSFGGCRDGSFPNEFLALWKVNNDWLGNDVPVRCFLRNIGQFTGFV
jgi:hypothetical protein